MLGRTHLLFGIFLCTFFTQPLVWFILLLSSLFPDIDSTTSFLGRKAKFIGKTFEHRGFFHSFFFFIPFSLLLASYSWTYGVAFFLGCGSHLVLDMMTKQGLRLFPFKKRLRGPIKVGGISENIFFFLLLFIVLFRLI